MKQEKDAGDAGSAIGRTRSMTVRIATTGYEHIQHRADDADVDVSRMVRRMLAFAAQNMPANWVPSPGDRV